MARNGSGVMSIPYPSFTANTTIQSAQVNSDFSTIVDEISNSIAADGQTTITANIPFNSNKITGLGTGTARTDGANLATVQDGAVIWCGTAGGTADALTLSPSPAITAYAAGQTFRFKAGASANTGAATVAVSGLAAIAVQNDGSALAAGDIAANKWYEITYDGAAFQTRRIRLGGTGTGDVVGPASATANALVLFDGTTGKLIKDSTYTITAAGAALLDDASAAAQATTLGLGTGDSPQFTAVNIGHASDTTITRTGAGDIAVEGNAIYRAGGTDVPVADGGTGASSLTAYAVLCGGTTSTGAVQPIASVGTAGQILTSNGAGALPTFQTAAGGGGAYEFVSSATASSSTTIDFTGFVSGYDYIIVFDNLRWSLSGATFVGRVGTGAGPTWETTAAEYYYHRLEFYTSTIQTLTRTGNADRLYLWSGQTSSSGASTSTTIPAGGGRIELINPGDTTGVGILAQISLPTSDTNFETSLFGGGWDGSKAVTGFRVYPSGGNWSEGNFKLYRRKRSA